MRDDATDEPPTTGRLDHPTMQTIGRRAQSHRLVTSWEFVPNSLSPRSLEISLHSAAYPESVTAARIEIHWFVTGDYYVHYIETRGETQYQCRWDRHPKTNAPRTHFHPPPNAGEAVDSPVGTHPLAVLFAVLDWVNERVDQL